MNVQQLTKFIPLMSPLITEEDITAAVDVLRSGMLVQNVQVKSFEKNVSQYINTNFAAAVSNGTASLHLSLKALGIKEGDEVIVPAFSYIATANVVELVGAKPVFVDVCLDTFNIDVTKIEANITKRTKAIMPVHEFGLAADMSKILDIAKKHDIHIIEDAACALGATDNGQYAGSFGDFGSFSFHPRKAITSGEGGMITTNDPDLLNRVQILRNHGIEYQHGKMEFVEAGFNYRLTDFQGGLLNSQFKRLENQLKYKRNLAETYFEYLTNPLIKLPTIPKGKEHAWQTFHVVFDDQLNRDELILKLKEKGIGTNYGAQCMPAQKFYQKKYRLDCKKLYPNALKAFESGLAIPLYEKLLQDDIVYICEQLNKIK